MTPVSDHKAAIISVPHSGTRTLQQYITQSFPELVIPGRDNVIHWHVNLHPDEVAEFLGIKDKTAYVPIRNPADLCDSWERRYGDAPDKAGGNMVAALRLMFGMFDSSNEKFAADVIAWKIEDLPVLRGHGPMPENWDRQDGSGRLNIVRSWILARPAIADFYRELYTPEELWWL